MAVWSGGLSSGLHSVFVQAYESSVDIPNNRSLCHADIWVAQNGTSGNVWWLDAHWGWSLSATGPTGVMLNVSGNWSYDFRNYDSMTIWGGDFWVPHASNGTATLSVSGGIGDTSGVGSGSASGAIGLTTIPRFGAGRHNGSSWLSEYVERWNGSAWVLQTVERYTGSAWQKVAA